MEVLRKFFGNIFVVVFGLAALFAIWLGSVWFEKTWYLSNQSVRYYVFFGAAIVLSALGSALGGDSKK